jgi:hypothetical protein
MAAKKYSFLPAGTVLPAIMSIDETVKFTKNSRSVVYLKLKSKAYKAIKTGRRTGVITISVLDDIERELAASEAEQEVSSAA